MADWKTIDFLKKTSVIQGSPETTTGKVLTDGSMETYSNYAERSRKQINFHNMNGTDISSIRNAMVSGIVGSSINIQCRTDNHNINKSFEELLQDHARVDNFEVTGRFHRDEAFRQVISAETMQGGVLVRHHYNNSWKIPYRVELISVNMIDTSKTDYLNQTYNGLKKDVYGRITGIYLYTDALKTQSKLFNMNNITYYSTTWIDLSQYTSVSRMVSILPTLDAVKQYASAEVQSALERAKSGSYWHTELYGTILNALNDEFKSAKVDGNEKIIEAQALIKRLAERGISAHGATAIPVDDKITQIDTKTDSVYDTITNQSQKAMSSAVGGSQVSVYKDISIGNYSSIKGAIASDEEHYKIEFDKLSNLVIADYLRRLFQVGVQKNIVSLSRTKYFNNREKYHKFDILRTSKKIIDEVKDANAISKHLESGTTTRNKVFAEKGLDFATEMKKSISSEIEVELMKKEMYEKAGLVYVQTGTENAENKSKKEETKPLEEEEENEK